jgi:hypothetical protein
MKLEELWKGDELGACAERQDFEVLQRVGERQRR